jgi:hypothetical protein
MITAPTPTSRPNRASIAPRAARPRPPPRPPSRWRPPSRRGRLCHADFLLRRGALFRHLRRLDAAVLDFALLATLPRLEDLTLRCRFGEARAPPPTAALAPAQLAHLARAPRLRHARVRRPNPTRRPESRRGEPRGAAEECPDTAASAARRAAARRPPRRRRRPRVGRARNRDAARIRDGEGGCRHSASAAAAASAAGARAATQDAAQARPQVGRRRVLRRDEEDPVAQIHPNTSLAWELDEFLRAPPPVSVPGGSGEMSMVKLWAVVTGLPKVLRMQRACSLRDIGHWLSAERCARPVCKVQLCPARTVQ